MKKTILPPLILLATMAAGKAAIVWTGAAGDNSFWTDGNWNFSSSTMTGATFNPLTTVTDDILIENAAATILIAGGAASNLLLGDGWKLTVVNSTVTASAGMGANGTAGGTSSFLELINSTVTFQFFNTDLKALVDSSSQLRLLGAGAALGNQSGPDTVALAPGGSIAFVSSTGNSTAGYGGLISNSAGGITFLADYYNGSASAANAGTGPGTAFSLTGDSTPFVNVSPNTAFTITAIPEPATVTLGGIGLLVLLRRRR